MKTNKMTANIITVLTVLTLGLIAGLYYGYVCSVNGALGTLTDSEYVKTMQAINIAIQNPVFYLSFFGTLILLPLATWVNYQGSISPKFIFLLVAGVLYIFGSFGVTVAGNVPLNDALANIDVNIASIDKIKGARINFQQRWNLFHNIRTMATIGSFLLSIVAAIK